MAAHCGWTNMKVLLVDDDPAFLSMLSIAFSSPSLDVKTCENGADAIFNATNEPFDVVITDYRMPGVDGIELTRMIRRLLPSAVIVGMSGYDVKEKFLSAGANDFLQKPFDAIRFALVIDGAAILA